MDDQNSKNTAASAQLERDRSFSLHPDTRLGSVSLRVADLARSIEFYERALGFHLVDRQPGRAQLGTAGGRTLLMLREVAGARPMPRRASGLYHFAILVPSRPDLGRALRRLAEARVPIGEADHLVSEALYLADPDRNGIEIYRDRPRDSWKWRGGSVQMAVDPLDLAGILAEGERDARPDEGLPDGTRIGHLHLQVSSTDEAWEFYCRLLGFSVTSRYQGALFAAAGGYHHHLGLNTWSSLGAPPAPPEGAGIDAFVIEVPDDEALGRVAERLADAKRPYEAAGSEITLRDPWNIEVVIRAAARS